MKHELATNPAYTEEFIQWFWAHVQKTPCCWIWRKRLIRPIPPIRQILKIGDRSISAHRVSYELTHGDIPKGYVICHACDNSPCVRPDHLFLGTPSENQQDRQTKGRRFVYFDSEEGWSCRVSPELMATELGITVGELLSGVKKGTIAPTMIGYNNIRYVLHVPPSKEETSKE